MDRPGPLQLRHLPESTASAGGAPFGFNILGCDYYSHAIYGAQPSLAIAIGATVGVVLIGGSLGLLAGFYGGWADTIISRIVDVFLSLPFLLGALVFLTVVKIQDILMVLVILGWTTIARVMRGAVLSAKNLDYVLAARSLGAGNRRNRDAAHPAERRSPRDRARRSTWAASEATLDLPRCRPPAAGGVVGDHDHDAPGLLPGVPVAAHFPHGSAHRHRAQLHPHG